MMNELRKLPRAFFARDTREVARELLGKYLVCCDSQTKRIGRIVEVEAYLGPHDKAAHSARGRTPRTEVMFGAPGHAYVYLIYGLHHCLNVVTESSDKGAAVLLRAVEPIQGLVGRTQGPGLLCRAFGIDRRQNGHDFQSSELHIAELPGAPPFKIIARPRIGVDYAGHWARRLLRYYVKGSPFVSKL